MGKIARFTAGSLQHEFNLGFSLLLFLAGITLDKAQPVLCQGDYQEKKKKHPP